MIGMDNKTVKVKTHGRGGHKIRSHCRAPLEVKQYGQSGKWVSDLFPNLAKHVDDMAFIHSILPIHPFMDRP